MQTKIVRRTAPSFRIKKHDVYKWVWALVRAALLIGLGFIIIYPLLIKLSSSFKEFADLFDSTVQWIPRRFTWDNYQQVFIHMDYPSAFIRSFGLSLAVSVLQVIVCMMVGYGLARFEFPGKTIVFGCILFTIVVPPELLLIPLYLNFRNFNVLGLLPNDLNILNTHWPFLMMAATGTGIRNGLFIYIARQFFKGTPKSLEEAAFVDGAGPLKTFYAVMMPLAGAPMLVIFLLSFVWQWNDYFYTTLIYQRGSQLLAYMYMGVNRAYQQAYVDMYGFEMPYEVTSIITNTASIFYIIPVLLLYLFLQRYFMESVERSGIVG